MASITAAPDPSTQSLELSALPAHCCAGSKLRSELKFVTDKSPAPQQGTPEDGLSLNLGLCYANCLWIPPRGKRKRPVSPARSAAGASGSGQQDQEQGQGQAVKVVIAERRQVIKAALRGLVEAAQPDLSPAEVDAVVAEVNKRMTMGSKQCVLAAVLCLSVLLQSFLGQPTRGFPAAGPAPGPPPPPDWLPLEKRVRYALFVNRSLEGWQTPRDTCPRPFTMLPMVGVRARHFVIDDRVLHGLLTDLGMTDLTQLQFLADSLPHWQKFIQYSQLQNSGWEFARRVETDGVSISVHFVRSQAVTEPVELPFIGRKRTATSDYDPATHIAVGVDPAAIQPQLQQLAAATPAGTTLGGLHAHVLALKATWDALWEEYLKPRWRRQRLALHHAQERIIEGFCKKRIVESRQRPIELCIWDHLEALPPIGKEYQQGYKLVNDRLPKGKQWLHRAAEYRRGIDGRARNNA
ncbi:hypothetical protein QJQ45_025188 [Haematococcus lacustris]|nr:hypothetical protein QJQ45_025188 [Haematococcus lacustris]